MDVSEAAILQKYTPSRENLLMMLHDLQDNHPQQYLTEDTLDKVAGYLNLTRSAVYGVVNYYSMFSLKPRGRYIIRVCTSAVCEIMKSNEVIGHIEDVLGIRVGETTPCGLFTLEPAECLGQCQDAPSMMVNREVYNNLDGQRVREVLQGLRERGREGGLRA